MLYRGSVSPTFPPPSPSEFVWGETVRAYPYEYQEYYPVKTFYTYASPTTEIKRFIFETISEADFCKWSDDSILLHGTTPSDLRPCAGTLATRLATCPNLLAALQNRTPIKILQMGDSFQGGTSANHRPLIRRSYPGMKVTIQMAYIGYHGAEQWVATGQNSINTYVRNADPDVIFFGGISSLWVDNAAWLTLVDMLRIAKPGVEIVLASDARGAHGTPTSEIVAATALAKETAFYDAALTLDNYVEDSGWDIAGWVTDGTHFDPRGYLVLGRGWAWFLGASQPT